MSSPNGPSRLLPLEGHSLAHCAFHTPPVENFSTTCQPTNAVYGLDSSARSAFAQT